MRSSSQSPKWEIVAAFSFGVVFVSAIILIAIFRPNPTAFEYAIFRIVIALAAAGVGAILPGFLDVTFKTWLRAGGALAVFVIVYFFAPAALTSAIDRPIVEPVEDAKPVADEWLRLVDQGEYQKAYQSMAGGFTKKYPFAQFYELLARERRSLGAHVKRNFMSTTPYESPPGAPKGAYRQYVYRSSFSESTQNIYEGVWLAAENERWQVSGFFTWVKTESGQFVPYEPPDSAR